MLRTSARVVDKVNVLSIFRPNINRNLSKTEAAMVEKPVENSIRRNLESALNPVFLDVINESYMHNVPKGSETHFKVVVVSKEFENMPLLGRHRLVNSLLESELKNGVHALSIVVSMGFIREMGWDADSLILIVTCRCFEVAANSVAYKNHNRLFFDNLLIAKAPSQWDANEEVKPSPKCLGGFGK